MNNAFDIVFRFIYISALFAWSQGRKTDTETTRRALKAVVTPILLSKFS